MSENRLSTITNQLVSITNQLKMKSKKDGNAL